MQSVTLFYPLGDTWTELSAVATARRPNTATILTDRSVLVHGRDGMGAPGTAEFYNGFVKQFKFPFTWKG